MKVAIIIPYFTITPPVWMRLNLYSCSRQKNVYFIYFTDCDAIIDMALDYQNIICHKCSFEDYCEMVSDKLKIKFKPMHCYKLCDLKPFYGYIHEDILKEYDFWGYGDNDLVYGNLEMLTNDKMLEMYDVITTMAERIAGHFAIFRNNGKYSSLPFKCKKYKQYLHTDNHIGFDESDWVRLVLPEKRILTGIYKLLFKHFVPYTRWVDHTYKVYSNQYTRKFAKELFTTPIPKDSEIWTYNNIQGRMYAPNGSEIPYLHFLFFKKTKYLKTDKYWKGDYWMLQHQDLASLKNIEFSLKCVVGK